MLDLPDTGDFLAVHHYSRVSDIRNHFLDLAYSFENNSLLFNLLFSQKLSVSVFCKVVSYMRDSFVTHHLWMSLIGWRVILWFKYITF